MNRNFRLWLSFWCCMDGGLAAHNLALGRFFISGILAAMALLLALIATRGDA